MGDSLLKGVLLGLLLIISVGPVVFTIIKLSLGNGVKGGLSFVSGVWVSDFIIVFISNVFSEWVRHLLEHKRTIGYVGSVFLISLGVFYVFFKKAQVADSTTTGEIKLRKRDLARLFISGFLLNTLNPSLLLFWLVNATAFSLTHSIQERIIIFSVALGINCMADVAKVFTAGKLRKRLTVHNLSIINKISGTILIGFGAVLLYGAVFYKH
jgi:threonine/homoserine/homoserine lactone efflux protein